MTQHKSIYSKVIQYFSVEMLTVARKSTGKGFININAPTGKVYKDNNSTLLSQVAEESTNAYTQLVHAINQ